MSCTCSGNRSLQCRRFHRARANGFNRESAMLKLPKRGGNGASQGEGGGGGEKEEKIFIFIFYFFLPLPLPPLLFLPSHLPSGLILLLSPIFLCHRIKDGGFIVAIRLTSFHPPKISLHCRLGKSLSKSISRSAALVFREKGVSRQHTTFTSCQNVACFSKCSFSSR